MNNLLGKKVAIIQSRIYHYRVPFYRKLRDSLLKEGLELLVIHGNPDSQEETKKDVGLLNWSIPVKNKTLRIGNYELLWQSCIDHIRDCDLVIVQQENKILLNYLLLLKKRFGNQKVAFWGHGKNFQSESRNNLRERWKRMLVKSADWWFAYTEITEKLLLDCGYQRDQITVVQNSIDTNKLRRDRENIGIDELKIIRKELGIRESKIGIYCGSLYKFKLLDFLLDAAVLIKAKIPNFDLIIIGAGPESKKIEIASKKHKWIHYVGHKYGIEKALYLELGDVFLNPGMVGLSILDSFVFGLPFFTTDCNLHSPEIAYLEPSYNGIISDYDIDAYASDVIMVLKNDDAMERMSKHCINSSKKYSNEKMVKNFTIGIKHTLGMIN